MSEDEQQPQQPRLWTQLRRIAGNTPVLDVRGEVDLATAPALKEAITEAMVGSHHVIINMAEVNYMDSSGFGTLLSATKLLRPLGGSVHLVACNPNIERMLQITRLSTLFGSHASEEDAARAIAANGSAAV